MEAVDSHADADDDAAATADHLADVEAAMQAAGEPATDSLLQSRPMVVPPMLAVIAKT